ncbi:hypothetical protein DYU05_04065 [Mucilaginibacter terrenus]|uniref:Uncharacterized protein n=1 Tax=Mucilaginibacter terrenus TaxID=2482727 RepID=A0A3E2NV49_9SPHI|nr:hypothetical protein [Mucilaginibacter terrenus]RFZ84791.1 hypothetical protein DYU05_04065 [Mucilaginibacter terrenus]
MDFKTEPGTLSRKRELIQKREALEAQISVTVDPAAQALLRKDYREVINELDSFYDDIPEGQHNG